MMTMTTPPKQNRKQTITIENKQYIILGKLDCRDLYIDGINQTVYLATLKLIED